MSLSDRSQSPLRDRARTLVGEGPERGGSGGWGGWKRAEGSCVDCGHCCGGSVTTFPPFWTAGAGQVWEDDCGASTSLRNPRLAPSPPGSPASSPPPLSLRRGLEGKLKGLWGGLESQGGLGTEFRTTEQCKRREKKETGFKSSPHWCIPSDSQVKAESLHTRAAAGRVLRPRGAGDRPPVAAGHAGSRDYPFPANRRDTGPESLLRALVCGAVSECVWRKPYLFCK